ncbi:MAG: hypothetical protein M3443_12615 [Actinomycetota bacterium]|nr:hypothetical protein [Actinomycetota bacterium]
MANTSHGTPFRPSDGVRNAQHVTSLRGMGRYGSGDDCSEPLAGPARHTDVDNERTTARRRRSWQIISLVVVALAGWSVGGTMVIRHNKDAPLEPVREYLDAIARGEATTANAMVDPSGFAENVDLNLLTDKVLSAATQRIVVDDVRLAYGADLDADAVNVQVAYTVADQQGQAELRVERVGSTAGLLDEWRVMDPLLVPAGVRSLIPALDRTPVGDTVFPVGGVRVGWLAGTTVLRLPAAYELTGVRSRYVQAEPTTLVAVPGSENRVAQTLIHYDVTPELKAELDRRMTNQVNACFAALPNLPSGCPTQLYPYAEQAPRLVRPPSSQVFISLVKYDKRAEWTSVNYTTGDGLFDLTRGGDGIPKPFSLQVRVAIDADDQLTVTFPSTR